MTAKDQTPKVISHTFVDPKSKRVRSKKYVIKEFLGRGGFASCYKIKSHETEKAYACKIVSKAKLKNKSTRIKLVTEIKIHRIVSSHKHIVKFIKWFEDDNCVYIVLELCENKSVLDLLKRRGRFTETEVRYFLAQILSALRHLHAKNVIHRDLKLGNIFVNAEYQIKLGDFGLAAMLEWKTQRKMTICGTPNYIAPEILGRKTEGHSFEVDVWSLGVIMYTMLIGVPPFESEDVKSTYQRIKTNRYRFPKGSFISETGKNLIRRILQLDPKKRPSLKEIRLDPFFSESLIPKTLPKTTKNEIPLLSAYKESRSASIEHSPVPSFEHSASKREGLAELCENERNSFRKSFKRWRSTGGTNDESEETHFSAAADLAVESDQKPIKMAKTEDAAYENYEPPIWITCWIDYSSKYGVGYTLSNGVHGVFFNDSSKMLLHPDKRKIEYFEEEEGGDRAVERRETVDPERYRVELRKKVTLLKYFSEYLERKNGDKPLRTSKTFDINTNPIRVVQWYQTSKAKVFAFSNNVFQINFNDRTEVIVSPLCAAAHLGAGCPHGVPGGCSRAQSELGFYRSLCALSFTGKTGERQSQSFEAAISSAATALRQRAAYCLEVLKKVLAGGGPRGG